MEKLLWASHSLAWKTTPAKLPSLSPIVSEPRCAKAHRHADNYSFNQHENYESHGLSHENWYAGHLKQLGQNIFG